MWRPASCRSRSPVDSNRALPIVRRNNSRASQSRPRLLAAPCRFLCRERSAEQTDLPGTARDALPKWSKSQRTKRIPPLARPIPRSARETSAAARSRLSPGPPRKSPLGPVSVRTPPVRISEPSAEPHRSQWQHESITGRETPVALFSLQGRSTYPGLCRDAAPHLGTTIHAPRDRQSRRLLAFQQLQLCTACIPGGRVTRRERFHGRFFNNVQRFFLRSRLVRIHRCRWCLLWMLLHNNFDSTPAVASF